MGTPFLLHRRKAFRYVPPSAELLDDFTVLLLHCDGADASYDFPDTSIYEHAVGSYGVQVDADEGKFGQAAAFGGGQYLSVPSNSDFYFNGDFCFEAQVKIDSFANSHAVFFDATFSTRVGIYYYHPGQVLYAFGYSFSWAPELALWYHLAVTRANNVLRAFIQGNQIGTDQSFSSAISNNGATLYIGAAYNQTVPLIGWMDEIRISNGAARYTENFTPPILPYSDEVDPTSEDHGTGDENTVLLVHFDGADESTTFTDSTGRHELTAVGGAEISTDVYKFGGASGYFNGGDTTYVTTPPHPDFKFGVGDFTIEFFFSCLSGSHRYILSGKDDGKWLIAQSHLDSNRIGIYINGAGWPIGTGATLISDGTVRHACLERYGDYLTFYLDGQIELGPWSGFENFDWFWDTLKIGGMKDSGGQHYGYIDELRITKGFARYKGEFTPPVEPFGTPTPTTDTKVLLGFENNLEDLSSYENDFTATDTIEYSSDPTISGKCVHVNTAGTYLDCPAASNMVPRTNAFQIDFWINLQQISPTYNTAQFMSLGLTSGSFTGGIHFGLDTSRLWTYISNNFHEVTYSITLDQWVKIALVRNSSLLCGIFVNDVQIGDAFSDTTDLDFAVESSKLRLFGAQHVGYYWLRGYMDNFRLMIGSTLYEPEYLPV